MPSAKAIHAQTKRLIDSDSYLELANYCDKVQCEIDKLGLEDSTWPKDTQALICFIKSVERAMLYDKAKAEKLPRRLI